MFRIFFNGSLSESSCWASSYPSFLLRKWIPNLIISWTQVTSWTVKLKTRRIVSLINQSSSINIRKGLWKFPSLSTISLKETRPLKWLARAVLETIRKKNYFQIGEDSSSASSFTVNERSDTETTDGATLESTRKREFSCTYNKNSCKRKDDYIVQHRREQMRESTGLCALPSVISRDLLSSAKGVASHGGFAKVLAAFFHAVAALKPVKDMSV